MLPRFSLLLLLLSSFPSLFSCADHPLSSSSSFLYLSLSSSDGQPHLYRSEPFSRFSSSSSSSSSSSFLSPSNQLSVSSDGKFYQSQSKNQLEEKIDRERKEMEKIVQEIMRKGEEEREAVTIKLDKITRQRRSAQPNSKVSKSVNCQLDLIHPESLYEFDVHPAPSSSPSVISISILSSSCLSSPSLWPYSYPIPRAHFRASIFSGPSLVASDPPLLLDSSSSSLTTLLRLPESGEYEIQVKLMLWNTSVEMEERDWKPHAKNDDSNLGMWVNKPIQATNGNKEKEKTGRIKVWVDGEKPFLANMEASPIQASTTLATSSLIPPCGSPSSFPSSSSLFSSLPGRLFLGSPSFRRTRAWFDWTMPNQTILFDTHSNAAWLPYECSVDYQVSLREILNTYRWVHMVGDSNVRHLFMTLCSSIGGVQVSAADEIQFVDPPFSCLPNSTIHYDMDGDKKVVDEWIITYTSWFWQKEWTLPLDSASPSAAPTFAFKTQCDSYLSTSYTSSNVQHGMIFKGWPGCSSAAPSIFSLPHPGLTYFLFGSHAAELGLNPSTRSYLRSEIYSSPYFQHFPTLFGLTTAVELEYIPEKYRGQHVYRNNERIQLLNEEIVDAIQEMVETGKYQWVKGRGGRGEEQVNNGGLVVFDPFHFTHSSFERLNCDVVHFCTPVLDHLAKMWSHFVRYGLPFANDFEQ